MIKKNLIILCSLILFLSPSVIRSQVEGILYGDKIAPGSTLLIITNQEIIETDSGIYCSVEIRKQAEPLYFMATFHRYDSIEYQLIDSNKLLSEMINRQSHWLYFVHGAGKNFEKAVWSGFDIQHFQKVNVVVYSWPSSNPNLKAFQDVKNSLSNMQLSTQHFGQSLQTMQAYRNHLTQNNDTLHLSLFLHSMGNMFLKQMIERNELSGFTPNLFDNIIINAAAVDETGHKTWVEKLKFQRNIFIMSNEGDVILKGLRLITKQGMQLGEKVFSQKAGNAIYIDFDKAVGMRMPPGISHTYFMAESAEKSPEIRDFYHSLFNGYEASLNDSVQFLLKTDGQSYQFMLPDTTNSKNRANAASENH